MPSEEYSSVARGALKLKGAKIHKSGKKSKEKKVKQEDLENALQRTEEKRSKSQDDAAAGDDDEEQRLLAQTISDQIKEAEQQQEDDTKTEAERRFAEIKRKRLKELAESSKIRPELLKTHKQRVEELNSHLSRLSEHHDMPKIGPG